VSPPPHYCETCLLDLQSAAALKEHQQGKKHQKKLWRTSNVQPSNAKRNVSSHVREHVTEEEFFEQLASGKFRNIVVCTGAGVSTNAGIPDFRSNDGLFASLQSRFGERFPALMREPETFLSRSFASKHPQVWRTEIEPLVRSWKSDCKPTAAHAFCSWLYERGWLKRVYTQNVDGLHTHPSLLHGNLAAGFEQRVVEVHGAFRDASIVLYGDRLPSAFFRSLQDDFAHGGSAAVDLMLVMGTALQVAPFCAVPNLAPVSSTRVLVNRRLADAMTNDWSRSHRTASALEMGGGCYGSTCGIAAGTTTKLAGREVSLRPKWGDKRWSELLVDDDCDRFVERFFAFRDERSRESVVDRGADRHAEHKAALEGIVRDEWSRAPLLALSVRVLRPKLQTVELQLQRGSLL